jgi:hypothetical protein
LGRKEERKEGEERRQTYLKTSSHEAIVENARKKAPKPTMSVRMFVTMSVRREEVERDGGKKGRESGYMNCSTARIASACSSLPLSLPPLSPSLLRRYLHART